jgi:tetratricopeptide (TPR) repeat protein
MRGSGERRSRPALPATVLQTGVIALCFLAAFAGLAAAVDPPAAKKPDIFLRFKRTTLLAERNRLWREANRLRDEGKVGEAIPAARQALAIHRRLFGNANADVVKMLVWLAQSHLQRDEFEAARTTSQEASAIGTKLYGEKDWRVADARQALRDVDIRSRLTVEERRELFAAEQGNSQIDQLYRKGDFRQAIRFAEQVAKMRRRLLGDQHPDTADSLNTLALLHNWMADYAKAEPLYRQALEIRRKVLGENHPRTAMSLNNLAALSRSLGDFAKAEPLYRQALEIDKKALGENHPDTAKVLNNLADLYESLGDYAKAEPLYRQALEIDRKALGETHPGYARDLSNLGELYQSLGDYAKAERLLRQALEIDKKARGENHPDTAQRLNNLAGLYQALGDYAKAEPLHRRALQIRKKVLGENHPGTATSLNNLAALYRSQGDYAKAEPLYRQALEIDKKALGENHPDTARALNNLALLYKSLGDDAKAEPLYRQSLEIRKKVLGENHARTATSLNNLSALYWSQGDYAKAEPLCRQSLEISLGGLSRNFGFLSERQQLALELSAQGFLYSYLSLASSARIGDGAVYAYVLESKGAVTARQSLVRLKRRRPDLKHLLDELQTVGTRLANLSLAGADPQHAQARLQKIEALTEQKEMLEGKLAAQYHEFAQTRDAARLGRDEQLRKLKAAIPPQAALVDVLEYTRSAPPSANKGPFGFERRLVAFVVRHDAEVRRIELGPVAPVAKAIDDWRQTYGRPGASNPGSDLRASCWLSQLQ